MENTTTAGQKMVDYSLRWNPTIRFLVDALNKSGCPVSRDFFRVRSCTESAGGGFSPDEGVVLCSNHVTWQSEVDVVLAHELIHAYDHCRARNLDWSNLHHHACSEIRAANLSGGCHMAHEAATRGADFVFREGHPKCVRRKAELSVAMNPFALEAAQAAASSAAAAAAAAVSSSGQAASTAPPPEPSRSDGGEAPGAIGDSAERQAVRGVAREAVEAVWRVCYSDTAPFDQIP